MAAVTNTNSPFMCSVTATGTAQQLYTLLAAIFSQIPIRAQLLRIQLDPSAGSTSLYVGNGTPLVTSANCGVNLSAGQVQDIPSLSSNLINLQEIYLLSSSGSIQVNVTLITR